MKELVNLTNPNHTTNHSCQGIMRHELSNEQPLATLVASSHEVGQATALQQPNCPSLLHELACVRPGGAVEALDGDGGARAEEGPW